MRRLLFWAALPLLLLSCAQKIHDPGKDDKGDQNPDGLVAVKGFYTLKHEGFEFKIREEVYNSGAAQDAIAHLKEDLTEINGLIPESALKVMKKNPIWLEKDLTDGAAWYHANRDWLAEQGKTDARYMTDKWHCVELCNYVNYVSWSDQNQPYMVLHELCHLYHDQALSGGFENPDVKAAYNHAKSSGMYKNTPYRLDSNITTTITRPRCTPPPTRWSTSPKSARPTGVKTTTTPSTTTTSRPTTRRASPSWRRSGENAKTTNPQLITL